MKKLTALLLSVLLVLALLPLAVFAEGVTVTNPRYDPETRTLHLSWTDSRYIPSQVDFPDGTICKLSVGASNTAAGSIHLRPGKYEPTCVFTPTGGGETVRKAFKLDYLSGNVALFVFKLSQHEDTIRIEARDEFGKIPVGLQVSFEELSEVVTIKSKTYTEFPRPSGVTVLHATTSVRPVSYGEGDASYTITYTPAQTATLEITLTPEEQLGFSFAETGRTFDDATGTLSVTWNVGDGKGAYIEAVLLDGERYEVSDSNGAFTVVLGDIPHGSHELSYVFRRIDGETVTLPVDALERGGTLKTSMQVAVEANRIVVLLTDRWDRPVAGAEVELSIGNTRKETATTNSLGKATFRTAVPLDVTQVLCFFAGKASGKTTYLGCTGALTEGVIIPPVTNITTSVQGDSTTKRPTAYRPTTTKKPTGTTQTQKVYPTISGAGTTSMEQNDMVAVNVTYDQGILDQFGLTESVFSSRARLLLPSASFHALAGDTGKVMLSARYSPYSVTSAQISKAIANQSKFSLYDASNTKAIAIDMGLLLGNADIAIPFAGQEIDGERMTLQVWLPVPDSMKECPVIAVAATDAEGLNTPVAATVEDGYVKFSVSQLTTFTLLGFSENNSKNSGGVPMLVIVLLIIGVLLLIGAGLLLYFFVIRKPAPEEDELPPDDNAEHAAQPADGPVSYQDAVTPLFPADEYPASVDPRDLYPEVAPYEDPDESRDIFSSDDRERQARRPHSDDREQ